MFYLISDLLNPSEKGSYFRIQHVKSGKLLDPNSSGDTFLSISNNSISQIWKWDGKYLANAQNVKNKLCLYSSLKSSSQNQRWTIFGRTLKDFKIMTPELFWMLCSKSTQEPELEFFAGILNFFLFAFLK